VCQRAGGRPNKHRMNQVWILIPTLILHSLLILKTYYEKKKKKKTLRSFAPQVDIPIDRIFERRIDKVVVRYFTALKLIRVILTWL
jgi:hypothetical protein